VPAQAERFHFDVDTAVVPGEGSERARAPEVPAVAPGGKKALVALTGVLDLTDFVGVRDRVHESVGRMEVQQTHDQCDGTSILHLTFPEDNPRRS
jgi:hypothetical protein